MSLLTSVAQFSPFGPIFGKELRTTARRKRTYVLRVVYLALLLFPILMMYAEIQSRSQFNGSVALRNQQQSELGEEFFAVFGVFSVFMMGLIGPVLTANTINSERLQKTLPVLLMTPISAWQIVAGKLFSRLLVSFTLIALGLPVLALVRLLGGVELASMLEVIALALIAAMSSAAIGLFFSTVLDRAYAVILVSIGTMLFLYLFVPFVIVLSWKAAGGRGPGMVVLQVIMAINPYFMVFGAAVPDFNVGMRLSLPWAWCIGLHLAMTALLLGWSAALIRRRAKRFGAVDTPVVPPVPLTGAFPVVFRGTDGTIQTTVAYDGPAPVQRRRDVSDNPILWREVRRPLLPRVWQRVVAVIVIVGAMLTLYSLIGANNGLDEPNAQMGWSCAFNALLCFLTLVISSTAIAQEKEGDTWTLLMASPVSGPMVVWGKALGVLRRLVWPLALVALHLLMFAITGVISPSAGFLAFWIIVSTNMVWIATGIYFSLRFRHVTVAVIANLVLVLGIYLMSLMILGLLSSAIDRNPPPDEVFRQTVLQAGVVIVGLLIAGWWLQTVYTMIVRPGGALGRLMIATPMLIIAAAAVRPFLTGSGEPIEQLQWYVPYVLLAQMRWRPSGVFELTLPEHTHLTEASAWAYLLFLGLVHIALAAIVLALASWKFSGIVGRAPQRERWVDRPEPGGRSMMRPAVSTPA